MEYIRMYYSMEGRCLFYCIVFVLVCVCVGMLVRVRQRAVVYSSCAYIRMCNGMSMYRTELESLWLQVQCLRVHNIHRG